MILLHLKPEPAGVDHRGRDVNYRLKVALKRLLRDYGLRCIRIGDADGSAAGDENVKTKLARCEACGK